MKYQKSSSSNLIPIVLLCLAIGSTGTYFDYYHNANATPVSPTPSPWPSVEEVEMMLEPEPVASTCTIEAKELVLLSKINAEQAILLEYAYNVAKTDGHNEPSVLQGLIWQESHAGNYPGHEVAGDEYGLRVGKRYYGVGQIKVAAAKDVLKRFSTEFPNFKGLADDEIIANLILNDKFNIRIASKYLWMMGHNETKKPVYVRPTNYAITAYNRGLGNTYNTDYNNWHYTVGVHNHKDTFIKKFNQANDIN